MITSLPSLLPLTLSLMPSNPWGSALHSPDLEPSELSFVSSAPQTAQSPMQGITLGHAQIQHPPIYT